MKRIHLEVTDHISIAATPARVFETLRAPDLLDGLSQNVADCVVESSGLRASRTLLSHGLRNHQELVLEVLEPNAVYQTVTTLVGFEVVYRYQLQPEGSGARLQVTKTARGGWWSWPFKGLVRHLLSQPEHDGDHLARIKRAVES